MNFNLVEIWMYSAIFILVTTFFSRKISWYLISVPLFIFTYFNGIRPQNYNQDTLAYYHYYSLLPDASAHEYLAYTRLENGWDFIVYLSRSYISFENFLLTISIASTFLSIIVIRRITKDPLVFSFFFSNYVLIGQTTIIRYHLALLVSWLSVTLWKERKRIYTGITIAISSLIHFSSLAMLIFYIAPFFKKNTLFFLSITTSILVIYNLESLLDIFNKSHADTVSSYNLRGLYLITLPITLSLLPSIKLTKAYKKILLVFISLYIITLYIPPFNRLLIIASIYIIYISSDLSSKQNGKFTSSRTIIAFYSIFSIAFFSYISHGNIH